MTLAMNGILEGLTLGLSGGLTCPSCAAYAPPVLQAAAHGDFLGVPVILYLWAVVIVVGDVRAELHHLRPLHLRHRQQCPRELPRRHQRHPDHDHPLCA